MNSGEYSRVINDTISNPSFIRERERGISYIGETRCFLSPEVS